MTNRQWVMWKLIDMPDEEFANWVNVDCVYQKDGEYCADDCRHNCGDGHLKWLKQEHEGGDSQ